MRAFHRTALHRAWCVGGSAVAIAASGSTLLATLTDPQPDGDSVAGIEHLSSTGAPTLTRSNGQQHRADSGLSMKELQVGHGAEALQGYWVTIHYRARLIGDKTIIDDTRSSGYSERLYGQPLCFRVGDFTDETVLRALHAAVLDMRVGGSRRVRTSLMEPNFGYRRLPTVYAATQEWPFKAKRRLQPDWLVDVEVELIDVAPEPPIGGLRKVVLDSLVTVRSLFGAGPTSTT